jgi:hypothetical protein
MGKQQKTLIMIETARQILEDQNPMTVRQVYYQLVSRQVIENSRGQYQAVSSALVDARKDGSIPWEWIEDRLRRPRTVSMWDDLGDFAQTARKAYRRDVWPTQGRLVEVWLEKDALSGIFESVLNRYGVTLNVGRGYDGWDSIHNAAERYLQWERAVTILYFGDFDPSGEDMARSLRERLEFFKTSPEIRKCALIQEDIELYKLPPNFTKPTDTRRAAFVARYGDQSVELDALPATILRDRLEAAVSELMDLQALEQVRAQAIEDRAQISSLLADI